MSIHTPEAPVKPDGANPRDAKAELKAAKAYAKAQRPWYKKKRVMLPAGLFALIVVITAASGGGSTNTTSTPSASPPASQPPASQPKASQPKASQPKAQAPAPASGGPTAKLPIQNGDWRLDSIRVKDDGVGDFGGNARVTYTGANPKGGGNLFTLTVFVGGKDVAVLNGSADAVQPGSAVSVELISTDKFVGGPYKFDFQNDL